MVFAMENMRVGDIKGAFVLKAPMTKDAVVLASMQKIIGVGLLILLGVVAGFWLLSGRWIVRPLEGIAGQLNEGSTRLGSISDQLASGSQSVASGAVEQAASIEQTSASTAEIHSMIRKTADHARSATQKVIESDRRLWRPTRSSRR